MNTYEHRDVNGWLYNHVPIIRIYPSTLKKYMSRLSITTNDKKIPKGTLEIYEMLNGSLGVLHI